MKRLIMIVSLAVTFIMTGCVEHRYYTKHRDHSERYYRHHPHRHARPHVDVEIHN